MRIAAWLDLAVQVAGLTADAKDMLELVVVRFDLVPGDAPVLQMAVLGNERCAIAFLDARVHFEIMREKAARIAAPVCRRATDHLAWLECAHLAHRQRRLRVVVAKCDGVARQAGANDPNAGRVVSTCYPVGWPNGVRCRYGATSLLMSASEPLNS